MGRAKNYRSKKQKFIGNRYTVQPEKQPTSNVDLAMTTASSSKLRSDLDGFPDDNSQHKTNELCGNRIMDIQTLITVFSILCCPLCFEKELYLVEDSKFGLCSNFCLKCKKCSFTKGFASTSKVNNLNQMNILVVCALRFIGKGYLAGKKLFFFLDLPFFSKATFRRLELKVLKAAADVAQESMNEAAEEIKNLQPSEKGVINCGASIDGTWQKRGFSSLNGCVSCISIDTGKVLDVEVLSQFCRFCNVSKKLPNVNNKHLCRNHKGSASSMESVGAYRIFERSEKVRMLHYTDYYGDGDSKAYETVKNMYGINTVRKLECIGHVQKRVGSRLRKLKKTKKGLGGKGKLTDRFIDKLQNYYGISIRSNIGNIEKMQSALIAAFFHCCSTFKNPMHGQCPPGADSWCKFQRAKASGTKLIDKSPGLPKNVINIVKPVYMQLCDRKLLEKCLHGKTQNTNESFNGVLWNIIPKQNFVELQTLQLGSYIAVIQFNDGSRGVLALLNRLGLNIGTYTLYGLKFDDSTRVSDSRRHSSHRTKTQRKKLRAYRKKKGLQYEEKEGPTYMAGEF